jgi:hypothetical protein
MKKSLDILNDWKFRAILKKGILGLFKKKVLSTLNANIGGECNSMVTQPGSYQCGLATALMDFCFTDPDIGTYNPEKSIYFQNIKAKDYRDLAISNCGHMVYLKCSPAENLPNKHAACSGYLTAASNTGHKMMFAYDKTPEKWNVLRINKAKIWLKENADTFIENYGERWFSASAKATG